MSKTDSLIKKWVLITAAENIPLREGRAVQIGGNEVAIFNLGDRFLALENRCPHRSGPLADGIISGGNVVCPLHAWKVDLATGEVVNRTDNPPCVRTYPARVENGVISLEVPVTVSASEQIPANCFASISQVPNLSGNATSEV